MTNPQPTLTEFRANFGTVPHVLFPQAHTDGWLAVEAADELAARRALAVVIGGIYSSVYPPDSAMYPRADLPEWPHARGELGRLRVLSSADEEPRWEWLAGEPATGRWWVSWYEHTVPFEYHGPWWVTGQELGGGQRRTIVAAVLAADEDAARGVIVAAHDEPPTEVSWRFVEERPADWAPFSDRFPRGTWMQWPAGQAGGR